MSFIPAACNILAKSHFISQTMDDININNIYLHIEEANVDEEDWIKLNWINKESDNNENSQSSEIQKVT